MAFPFSMVFCFHDTAFPGKNQPQAHIPAEIAIINPAQAVRNGKYLL